MVLMRLIVVLIFFLQSSFLFAKDELQVFLYKPKYRSAQSFAAVLENAKSTEGRVSIDSRSNSVVVVDHPEDIKRIESLLISIDIAQKQVELKVMVTEVSEEFLQEIGITSTQTVLPPGLFSIALKLLQAHKESVVRSEMTLRTIDNEPAQLQVTQDQIFGAVVTQEGHHDAVVVAQRVQTGDFLSVIPHVNDDATLTVTVAPSRSKLVAGGVQDNSILTQVTIKTGDTVALGGVETVVDPLDAESRALGIPMYRQKSFKKMKVLMFLTAWIVEA